MAILIKTDGTETHIPAPKDAEEAGKILGGWVERVRPRYAPEVIFLCDEEGLLKKLPVNAAGCLMYGPSSPIVGDIIVMTNEEARKAGWE
jgi:hypothetical protein